MQNKITFAPRIDSEVVYSSSHFPFKREDERGERVGLSASSF